MLRTAVKLLHRHRHSMSVLCFAWHSPARFARISRSFIRNI